MPLNRRDLRAEGAEYGRAFADRVAAEFYGFELVPGGEDHIAMMLVADVVEKGHAMMAEGVPRKHAKRWAQAARIGAGERFLELKRTVDAMIAGGEPGVQ